jgi:outer membrane lipoprotein carrier protein
MYLETLLVTLLSAPVLAPVKSTVTAQTPAATQAPAPQAAPQATGTPKPAEAPKAPEAPQAAEAPKAVEASKAKKMEPEVKDLVDRMQAFYEKTQDFEASFQQDYKYKMVRRTQNSTGKVVFKKPGLMRWEYEKPSARTFVLAGEKVYAYDPEAQTLSVGKIDTTQLSASVTFLLGKGKLADEFSISKGTCADCKGTLLVLDPLKADPRFRQVRLEVDPKTAQVLKSTVIDPDGSENTIAFLNLKTNVGVNADRFKLNPPQGTRIDDFTKQRP